MMPITRLQPGQHRTAPPPHRSFAVEPIKLAYSVKEAADALGTSEASVWKLIRRCDIPTFRLPGLDRTLIKASDLIAFVDAQPSVRRSA
jgi:excisionase family DNA binding protein